MLNKYFVKFVPYNEKTLSSIINNSVKFSTVYEFNDFNELHYTNSFDTSDFYGGRQVLNTALSSPYVIARVFDDAKKSGKYTREILDTEFEKIKKNRDLQEYYSSNPHILNMTLENLAYQSVGIFCISSLEVFKDDAAQLMFAHYGNNLTGLALIYEIKKSLKVDYHQQKTKPPSVGNVSRIHDWMKGEFNSGNMDDFLNKSEHWKYEREHRLFGKRGINKCDENGLKIKGVFYTPRFDDGFIPALEKINDKFYQNNLVIRKVEPEAGRYSFCIPLEEKSAADYLKEIGWMDSR